MTCFGSDWKTAGIFMRLDVRSVKDTNADGIGDLPGLVSKLDYYRDIGVDVLQLSGHMPTDFAYSGTMHTGYYAVDPRLGTMNDFDRLIREAHDRSIAVVSTWAPFSTHPDHPYFQASRDPAHPDHAAYRDYYTWADGLNAPLPHPLARGQQIGHWEWDDARQRYFHAIWKTRDGERWCPETNPYSPEVSDEFEKMLRFWLERGLDGFWVDCGDKGDFRSYADHREFWKRLNGVIHSYPDRLSVSESGTYIEESIGEEGFDQFWCGDKPVPVFQTVFRDSPGTLVMGPGKQAYNGIHEILISYYNRPQGNQCSQVYTMRERIDFLDPVHLSRAKQYLAFALTLPVVPTLEMGVECGWDLVDYDLWSDYHHSPMMWSSGRGLGFSDAEPFSPFNPKGYPPQAFVDAQLADENSVLSAFRKLVGLRREHDSLQANDAITDSYRRVPTQDDGLYFAYLRRSRRTADTVLACFNLEGESRRLRLIERGDSFGGNAPWIGGKTRLKDLWTGGDGGVSSDPDGITVDVPGYGFRLFEVQGRG